MRIRVRAITAGLSLLLVSSPGWARLPSDQQACQKEVGKQGQSLFRTTTKGLRRCHDRISAGALPAGTDCTVEPATAGRIQAAADKFSARVTPRCPDEVVVGLVFGSACYGSDTAEGLVACETDAHQEQALALIETLYGTPPPLAAALRGCERIAAREAARFADRCHRLLRRCRDRVARGALAPDTDCAAAEANGIASATDAAVARIGARCPDASVAALDFGAPCSAVATSAGLATCLLSSNRARVDKLVLAEYGRAGGGISLARRITDAADCVGGPLSRCRAGDYLLANDRIRVVVQDVQRNLFGIGQFGGQIIDGDLVRPPGDPDRDNFEEWSTAVNIEGTAHYTDLTIVNDGSDGQAAILRASGVDDLLDFINASSVLAGFGLPFPASADDRDLPVEVVTDYVLEPGRNYVRVETTIQNVGATPLTGSDGIFFGDFLNGSGQLDLFQPGYGFGEPLATTRCPASAANPCNLVAYSGYGDAAGVSYGYLNDRTDSSTFTTSGVTVPLIGREVFLALLGVQGPNFELQALGEPGDSLTFIRHFIVGDGSVASIVDARNEILCLPTGRLEGTVTAGGSPVAGAEVAVLGSTAEGPQLVPLVSNPLDFNVVTHALTDAAGRWAATLPPGTYDVAVNLEGTPYEGGGPSPVLHQVSVVAFETVVEDLALPATGALQVTVVDEMNAPIPAKASVVGFDPSPDPRNTQTVLTIGNTTGVFNDLFEDGVPFGVPRVLFIDPSGDSGSVPLEPGSYRVVVSRGPEHSIATADVTVTAGATSTVNAQLARVLDTSGFIAGDFHVHSIDSPDSAIARKDRVVTMLAEGVDFFTPSDHDIRTDFQPTIAALGATSLLGTAPSSEITTFDYGHFNAWPMTIDGALVNGGSVDHGGAAPAGADFPSSASYSLTPGEIIAAAAADPNTDTVQVNHIHSHFGLEGGSGLAIDTGATPPESGVPAVARRLDPGLANFFSDAFDALEIWIGDDRSQVFNLFLGQNAGDWFNLINQGIVRTGIADSDTHRRMLTQAGVPRSMVASPTDAPGALGAIAETLSANTNDGRVIGTNAPMVRARTFAASTGQTGRLELGFPTLISTTDGAVDVIVEVQSPAWAEFDRVEYYVNTTTTKSVFARESGAGTVMVPRYGITPDFVQTKGTDFTVSTTTVDGSIPGADRLEATTTLGLSGLTEDIWVVVMVKGTDGLSRPLFPVVPNSLKTSTNATLADLIDGNLGEDGITALAFTNPLFVDVDGGGWSPPGVQVSNP